MTRLWAIDTAQMCDQHLLGEHSEMHQEVGSLRNHPHGLAIIEGHAEKGQVDTSLIQERHDELADELRARGMNHNSPMDFDDPVDLGYIDPEANRTDLADRCEDCRERINNDH